MTTLTASARPDTARSSTTDPCRRRMTASSRTIDDVLCGPQVAAEFSEQARLNTVSLVPLSERPMIVRLAH